MNLLYPPRQIIPIIVRYLTIVVIVLLSLSILYRIALRDLLRIRFCFMFRTAERIFRSAEHTFHSGERTFRSAEHKTNTVQRYIKYDYHVSFSPVILILLLLFIRHRFIGVTIKRYP